MTRRKLHVVYEHGPDLRPFGSAYVRLLRPLTHPTLHHACQVTASWQYRREAVDAVLVDRLWRADVSLEMAQDLATEIRRAGAKFLYALDDDFLSLYPEGGAGTAAERRKVVEFFLHQADGVIVTTPSLYERVAPASRNCVVVPNGLDERLIAHERPAPVEGPFGRRRLVIGYMGTRTHQADLHMILPAWHAVHAQVGDAVEFQIVGVTERPQPALWAGLPLRFVRPRTLDTEYPLFLLWFTGQVQWDIAVAPLADTPFNRGKSDIKFLDYAAAGAAGVFSRAPAYASSVVHRETGWLCDNSPAAWADALLHLLADEDLRTSMAHRASEYLYAQRTLARTAHRWVDALDKLLAAGQ